jgi:hypothetical protein
MRRRRLATGEENEFGYQHNKFTSRSAIVFDFLELSSWLYLEFDRLFKAVEGTKVSGTTIEDLMITTTLVDLDAAIDLFMLVNIPRLMDLQIRSIWSIYKLPCIMEIFEDNGLVPVQLNVIYGAVGFEFCATQGAGAEGRTDSPMLQALQLSCFNDETSKDLAASFTRQFHKLTDYAIAAAASSDLQDFLNNQISISNTQCEATKAGDLSLPEFRPRRITRTPPGRWASPGSPLPSPGLWASPCSCRSTFGAGTS